MSGFERLPREVALFERKLAHKVVRACRLRICVFCSDVLVLFCPGSFFVRRVVSGATSPFSGRRKLSVATRESGRVAHAQARTLRLLCFVRLGKRFLSARKCMSSPVRIRWHLWGFLEGKTSNRKENGRKENPKTRKKKGKNERVSPYIRWCIFCRAYLASAFDRREPLESARFNAAETSSRTIRKYVTWGFITCLHRSVCPRLLSCGCVAWSDLPVEVTNRAARSMYRWPVGSLP